MLLSCKLGFGLLNSELDAWDGTLAGVELNAIGEADAVAVAECCARDSEDEMLLEDFRELHGKREGKIEIGKGRDRLRRREQRGRQTLKSVMPSGTRGKR